MTSQGSAYARFQRALATQNLLIVRAAASELHQVKLADAARICALVARHEPHRYNATAIRWTWRYCTERRDVGLDDVGHAVQAFLLMPRQPERALGMLYALCQQRHA